jgi:1-phosphofructokinase
MILAATCGLQRYMMIYTVTLNPAVDKTAEIDDFTAGALNRVRSVRLDAGGKGINVSKVISSLGGRSIAMGILAGLAGRYIKSYLDERSIENEFIFAPGETRTNLKVIDTQNGKNTEINEPGPSVSECELEQLKNRLLERAGSDSIVIFSGSVPPGADKDIYFRWIKAVRQKGAKAILDADGELLKSGIKAGPILIKPNIYELGQLAGTAMEDERQAAEFAGRLLDDFGLEMVVVSLGERGALFITKSRTILTHGIKVDVKSTIGAGDSMVAALAYSIESGWDFERLAAFAAAVSAANVTTAGTQAAGRTIIAELEKQVRLEYL